MRKWAAITTWAWTYMRAQPRLVQWMGRLLLNRLYEQGFEVA